MSKYEPCNANVRFSGFETLISPGENIIWQGRPKKSAFIANKVVVMMPIAILWLVLDGGFISAMIGSGAGQQMPFFIIPFFLLHLMPVWIWLYQAITASRRWQNTHYAVTDRRIIIQNGFIGMEYQSIYYKDIQNVRLHIGVIDRMLGVGDIYFDTNPLDYMVYRRSRNGNRNISERSFLDIENARELYPRLQKIVMDIQTDQQYPNEFRPQENHGYNTHYSG